MAKSKKTKKCKALATTLQTISILLTVLPLAIAVIYAFQQGEPQEKFALGISITVATILVAYNIIAKMSLRSFLWVLLLGVCYCLDNIQTLLIIVTICTLIDELIITPLAKSYKAKFVINKEIDKREP